MSLPKNLKDYIATRPLPSDPTTNGWVFLGSNCPEWEEAAMFVKIQDEVVEIADLEFLTKRSGPEGNWVSLEPEDARELGKLLAAWQADHQEGA